MTRHSYNLGRSRFLSLRPVWHVWIPLLVIGVICSVSQPGTAQSQPSFRPGGMDTILYGAAYYPEYMPYDRLDKDVGLMQTAGISVERIGESSWASKEPQDG